MPSKKDKKHGCKKMYGSRLEVWNGTAYKTTGKLTKKDIRILEIGCGSGAFLAKLKYFLKN